MSPMRDCETRRSGPWRASLVVAPRFDAVAAGGAGGTKAMRVASGWSELGLCGSPIVEIVLNSTLASTNPTQFHLATKRLNHRGYERSAVHALGWMVAESTCCVPRSRV